MFKLFYEKTEKLTPVQQSEAGYSLLKEKLCDYYKKEPSSFYIEKDSKGCPYIVGIENVYVSITHTEGLVACAFADFRVGVDAEKIQIRRKSVEKRVFTTSESELIDNSKNENEAFFAFWTLKESYLKAIGTGFAGNAKEVEFSSYKNPIVSNKKNYAFYSEIVDEYLISVCQKTD